MNNGSDKDNIKYINFKGPIFCQFLPIFHPCLQRRSLARLIMRHPQYISRKQHI